MPKFFCDPVSEEQIILTGEDARHAGKVLRIKPGDPVTVSSSKGMDYECEVEYVTGQEVILKILSSAPNDTEPKTAVTLYQALPKGDKMDLIVQKAVELGVCRIVPVLTHRCVSRPDEKSMEKKRQRWQKIADEAAKQCGRGKLVPVCSLLSWKEAVNEAAGLETALLCYEKGGARLNQIVDEKAKEIGIFIGSEGGFEAEEVLDAEQAGIKTATLGKLILRCETAPLAAIAVIMNITGNL
ncbi:MAG: 16S rRNA (uracil(1498)-N(3))-methyltransferase [Massiliimalia sp.]|jgi:16S rRNA (uracil1498-N3)-methyltransferase